MTANVLRKKGNMTKNVIFTLLGASLLLATTVSCKRGPEAPVENNVASAEATLSGSSAPRALFVGQDKDGAPKDSPKKITWGGAGATLPMLIYQPTGTETAARISSMTLKEDYKGDLKVPYEDSNVASDGTIKFFATSGIQPATQVTKGAQIIATSKYADSKATIVTDRVNNGNVDMKKTEVGWPLISTNKAASATQQWNSIHKSGGGGVHFNLFGNVLLVMFDNISGEQGYTANSVGGSLNQHPRLTVQSNGMAFAGSTFTSNVFADSFDPWKVGTAKDQVTYTVSNLDFSDASKRQIVPVWFRPMTPANNEEFNITITWEVYNAAQSRWEKSTYKFRKPKNQEYAPNKTMFAHDDGRYYRMSVGISPVASAEFGSNSFYIVETNIPSFD